MRVKHKLMYISVYTPWLQYTDIAEVYFLKNRIHVYVTFKVLPYI